MIQVLFFIFFGLSPSASANPICLNSGKLMHIASGDAYADSAGISDDKNLIAIGGYQSDSFKVLDLKTGSITTFPKDPSSVIKIIKDEVVMTSYDGIDDSTFESIQKTIGSVETTYFNPKTGKQRKVKGQILYGDHLYTVLGTDKKNKEIILRNTNNVTSRISWYPDSAGIESDFSSEANADIVYNKKTKHVKIKMDSRNVFSATLTRVSLSYLSGSFTPDKNIYAINSQTTTSDEPNKVVLLNIAKQTSFTVTLPKDYRSNIYESNKFSKDSKHLLLDSGAVSGVKILNMENLTFTTLPSLKIDDPSYDSKGNICGMTYNNSNSSTYICANPNTGAIISKINLPMKYGKAVPITDNDYLFTAWGGQGQEATTYYLSDKEICSTPTPIECDCLTPETEQNSQNLEILKDLALTTACSKEFSESDWKNLPPPNQSKIDEKSSLLLLKRFSKPKGIVAEAHTGLLLGMIEAGLHKKYPSQFKSALAGVVYSSDRLYDSLIEKYPDLAKLSKAPDNSCLVDSEKSEISKAIYAYTKSRILTLRRPTFSELKEITSLAKDTLSTNQRTGLAELAAEQLVFSAGDSSELNQIFPSKIYKFSENKMRQALGLKHKDLTDITVVRNGEDLSIYELGLNSFNGSTETVAGFHIKKIKTLPVSSLPENESTESFNWSYGGKEYSASIDINKHKLDRQIVPAGGSPNYTEMRSHNNFNGMVIAGTNLGSGLTDKVMKQYIEYYTQQGFTFNQPQANPNIPEYLESRISGQNPIHYFIKEAHSDGDEKNLFRVTSEGMILKGTRTLNGQTETIELVYPTPSAKSELLSNQEFGQWIQKREKDGGPEMIYLNSSCWSKSKAVYEISSAASPTLINIPTTTSMTVFSNKEKNAMRIVIEGIRNGRTYAEIRKEMENDSSYSAGTGNVMIFPDQEEYKTLITDVLKTPVDVNPRLFVKKPDGTLEAYSIEDFH